MRLANFQKSKSFNLLLFTTFMFMAGYITQRISLTVFLNQNGFSLNDSYSLSTSYVALFAICSLAWGFIGKHLPSHKQITLLALLSVSLGLILVTLPYLTIMMAGITFLIIGGSLYFTFMSLVINESFDSASQRQQGNHLYQIMFNLGALIGVVAIGLMPVSTYHILYRLGAIFTLIGFFLVYKNYDAKNEEVIVSSSKQNLTLLFAFIGTFIVIYNLLKFGTITRSISTLGFLAGAGFILYKSWKEKNKNYLTFILMLVLCGFPYWLAVSIIYSQFTIFLTHQVSSTLFGFSIPPMAVLSVDAVANVIFGFGIYKIYKSNEISPQTLLLFSLLLTALAFLMLVVPLYLANGIQKISLIWPILSMSAYAVAEFLLITTLTSQISSLVKEKARQGIFVSMEYLGSGICASAAYYIIHTAPKETVTEVTLTQDLNLYLKMLIFTLLASFIYFLLNKLKFLEHKPL